MDSQQTSTMGAFFFAVIPGCSLHRNKFQCKSLQSFLLWDIFHHTVMFGVIRNGLFVVHSRISLSFFLFNILFEYFSCRLLDTHNIWLGMYDIVVDVPYEPFLNQISFDSSKFCHKKTHEKDHLVDAVNRNKQKRGKWF